MDAEKAFDRIELEYMFEGLEKFAFRSDFIDWVKLQNGQSICSDKGSFVSTV